MIKTDKQTTGLVGLRLRERRKQLGKTQVALAREVGISASYLNLIEADKRAIGGVLLQKVARALETDLDTLAGTEERRLIDHLSEAAADPQMAGFGIDPRSATALVSRHPSWAQAFLANWRDLRASEQQIDALAQRLDQDPALATTVHSLLNQATTVRSTTEVLDTVPDLTEAERNRFVDIILSRSADLSTQAQLLVSMFEAGDQIRGRSGAPSEEVDDLFIRNNSWFPTLEQSAEALRRDIFRLNDDTDIALSAFIESRLGYQINTMPADSTSQRGFRNAVRFDRATRRLEILDNAPVTTRRFQMARLIALTHGMDAIRPLLDREILTSDAAMMQAEGALGSHLAAAILLPYARFHAGAETLRYDIDALSQNSRVSIEQVCLRLLALRKPGLEGIPFGFLRTDPSGHISKRFPIAGLPLPGSGNGCPLWPIYAAHQTPERIVRQIAEFPNGGRFLFLARTIRQGPAGFGAVPFLNAVMLACDIAYADRSIYGAGLALQSVDAITPVGPTCRLCARDDCAYRGEPSMLANRNDRMTNAPRYV